jgi:MYXO-CTERM domain-containing protein
MTQCQGTGAIVCNGQYVETNNVQQCITALNGVLTTQITATGSATSTSSCDGGECSGQASVNGKVSCAAAPAGNAGGSFWALGAVVVGAIAGARRRARRA